MTDMMGRSFLKLLDYTPAEIAALLALAKQLKTQKQLGIPTRCCVGTTSPSCSKRPPPAPAAPLR